MKANKLTTTSTAKVTVFACIARVVLSVCIGHGRVLVYCFVRWSSLQDPDWSCGLFMALHLCSFPLYQVCELFWRGKLFVHSITGLESSHLNTGHYSLFP